MYEDRVVDSIDTSKAGYYTVYVETGEENGQANRTIIADIHVKDHEGVAITVNNVYSIYMLSAMLCLLALAFVSIMCFKRK
jgi:hypothetical protein